MPTDWPIDKFSDLFNFMPKNRSNIPDVQVLAEPTVETDYYEVREVRVPLDVLTAGVNHSTHFVAMVQCLVYGPDNRAAYSPVRSHYYFMLRPIREREKMAHH